MTLTDERVLANRHLVLEPDDLLHDGDVLRRDRLHRLDAVDEIVDTRRAEKDGERRLVVAPRVDGHEPLRERLLRDDEIRACDVQPDAIDLEVVLDAGELERRRLVRRSRTLEARVQLLDLRLHLPGFGLLGADRGVRRRRAGRETCRS